MGIGRKLCELMFNDFKTRHITVESSTYAIGVYQKLGFQQIGEPQESNGIRSVWMEDGEK